MLQQEIKTPLPKSPPPHPFIAYYILESIGLSLYVKGEPILEDINLSFHKNKITAIIGPSGSGKTTLLRCFNRMNDLTPHLSLKGKIFFKGNDINNDYNVYNLRRQIGMVFQKPTVFPRTIYQNVLFGIKHFTNGSKGHYSTLVEDTLIEVSLWDEVKDRLHKPAKALSCGQQQRLCIARCLALEPDVILLDEPTSSLDPKSTEAIEGLIKKLRERHTIIFVTHNIEQARRIADYMIFICNGRVCETGEAKDFFENPCHEETKRYIGLT